MNKAKATDCDCIDFLIGMQRACSCTEAERVQPDETCGPSHDAFTRHLHRLFPSTDRLWAEVREHADPAEGCLICDAATLDKFCSRKIELAARHWSGKHERVASGINPVRCSGRTESAACLSTSELAANLLTA